MSTVRLQAQSKSDGGSLNTSFESRAWLSMYPLPAWRRVLFVAILIIVIIIAFAPSTTQGTVTIRLYSLSTPSLVTHVYLGLATVQLHEAGFPNSTGWITISQGFPGFDLVSSNGQISPQTIMSSQVRSGRYDAMSFAFSNSTVILAGRAVPLPAPSVLSANMTVPVPPNGIGDVLLVLSFDYSALFATQPSLSLMLIKVSTV